MLPTWTWIPIVFVAAGAQTVRNAAQRGLTKSAGTLPATFVRFFYGLPFAVVALVVIGMISPLELPALRLDFLAWIMLGAVSQLLATAFLLAAMEQRSFIVAVAYSKTELLQIALYSVVLLGEPISTPTIVAIVLATMGVLLLSINADGVRSPGVASWLSPAALLGLASGAGFALAAVGYRGATVTLVGLSPWASGVYAVVWAQAIQSLLMGIYLLSRNRVGLRQVIVQWRISTLAGAMGAFASMGWLTAFAMRGAADVRTVGLVEVIYGYVITRGFFKERVTVRETLGIALVAIGILVISAAQ